MISAILLAAGESQRMGSANKLLLPFGDRTFIEHSITKYLATQVDEVIVVVGHENKDVLAKIEYIDGIKTVVNSRYKEGMTTSIQAGVKESNPKTNGYLIAPTDLPFITIDEINQVIQEFRKNYNRDDKLIAVPNFNNQDGHPIIFSNAHKTAILNHTIMSGCKQIKKDNPHHVIRVHLDKGEFLVDIDTKEDYNNLAR